MALSRADFFLDKMKVRTERLETLRAAHFHASGDTPEEDAYRKLVDWAEREGLPKKGARLFGRNTYPTNNPETYGYEFFLTVGQDVEPEREIDIKEVPGGLYVVLRFKNLERIGEAWRQLWQWIKENGYEHVDWKKGEHGWVNGFEEHLNWQENKPPNEWLFDLWVQLKE